MAVQEETDDKLIMLAQSFMPAQEAHIITNQESENNPWYEVKEGGSLRLPEWQFGWDELKRF